MPDNGESIAAAEVLDRVDAFVALCEKSIELQRSEPRGWTRNLEYQAVKKQILEALPQIEQLARTFHPTVSDLLRKTDGATMHEKKLEAAIELRGALKSASDTAALVERFRSPGPDLEAEIVEGTIIETSSLQPFESEFDTDLTIGLPDWGLHWPTARLRIGYRRLNRAEGWLADTAELSAKSVEDVMDRLCAEDDDPDVSILESALEGAMRSSDRQKIRSLARVAANALAGDDAAIRMSSLVLPEVLLLEAHHVAVLVDVSSRGPMQGRVVVGTVRTGRASGDEGAVEAVLAQLNGRGLIANQGGASTIGPPQASYYITQLGYTVLKFLVDYPQHPEHQSTLTQ